MFVLTSAAFASAEPMKLQERTVEERPGLTEIQPWFDRGLERPTDQAQWHIGHSREDDERPEIPTGIIATIGRFGLKFDSSGNGLSASGLAWSPNRSLSFVAGGSLGGGGASASLAVRLSF